MSAAPEANAEPRQPTYAYIHRQQSLCLLFVKMSMSLCRVLRCFPSQVLVVLFHAMFMFSSNPSAIGTTPRQPFGVFHTVIRLTTTFPFDQFSAQSSSTITPGIFSPGGDNRKTALQNQNKPNQITIKNQKHNTEQNKATAAG